MTHDHSRWGDKLWRYYPVNYDPNHYHSLVKWWLDLVPKYGDKIMEIGPYSGLALIWLKQNFPEKDIVGVEINPIVKHYIETRLYFFQLLGKVPIYQHDAMDLSAFPDKSKDCIFSGGLYEHFPEEERIKMIKEHLRVAKYVICEVPIAEVLVEGTGYGDEIPLTVSEWEKFMFDNFKVVKLDSYYDIYEYHAHNGSVAFVLEGVKDGR